MMKRSERKKRRRRSKEEKTFPFLFFPSSFSSFHGAALHTADPYTTTPTACAQSHVIPK